MTILIDAYRLGPPAVAYLTLGAALSSTGGGAIPLPTDYEAGDLLLTVAMERGVTFTTTPTSAGFTQRATANGGAGAEGNDTGQAYINVCSLVAAGLGSDGNPSVDGDAGKNCALAVALAYRRSGGSSISLGQAVAADNTAGTAWSAPMSTNPGITAGDTIMVASAVNGSYPSGFSNPRLAVPGLTGSPFTMTARALIETTTGFNGTLVVHEVTIPQGAGTATGNATFTMTSGVNGPAGVSALIRMRAA